MVTKRLKLTLPPTWKIVDDEGFYGVVIAQGMVLEVPDLEVIPEDIWDWSRGAAKRDIPRDMRDGSGEIVVTGASDHATELGWPIALYESEARREGKVLQARMHAVFAMLDHGSIVVARAVSVEKLAAHRDEVMKVLMSAQPDWGRDPRASVHELFRP